MPTLIAYVLTLTLIPILGGLMFVVSLPLISTVSGKSAKFYRFTSQAITDAARCGAAWLAFQVLGVVFGLGPIMLIGAVVVALNIVRLGQSLQAYAGRLEEHGLKTNSDAAALETVRLFDGQFRALHSDVGDDLAGLIGGIVGISVSICLWLSMNGALS